MNELVIIVEGETEQTFVRDQLSAHLVMHGIASWAVLPGRNRKRGGVKKWESASKDICYTLKEGRYCSTMFDYYAMPLDWPGRLNASNLTYESRSDHVESQLLNEITEMMGGKFDPRTFIPYVQLHEFEALVFADVNIAALALEPLSTYNSDYITTKLTQILTAAGNPEAINDGYETCPSRRISGVVPAYKKRFQGPIITQRIGINTLRNTCKHFEKWLLKLESIGK